MAYKILTPKELLAQTLAQAQKQTTPGYVDPNASKVPTTTAAVVTPTPTGGFTSFDAPKTDSEKAVLAQFYGSGAATTPAYTAPASIPLPTYTTAAYTNPSTGPLVDAANVAFAEYKQSATSAANNVLDAQMAQANSLINSGGIWATLQPIADRQMSDSIAALTQISTVAKANVESSRVALNAQDAANYAMVIDTLDKAVVASRQQTTENMNQRGMFFSTVLDAVMGGVNAAYTTQKGQAAQQDKASLAKIASDMAVLSGNIDIETIKGNASAVAQYTAEMLSVTATDAQTKQTAQALLASLNTQKAGVVDAVAAQVFATGQDLKATAFSQQEQLNTDALNAANEQNNQNQQAYTNATNAANNAFSQQEQLKADSANALAASQQQTQQQYANTTDAFNTAFTQNLQTNAATADATTTAQNEFIAGMGQYANDYQAAANNLNPNDPLYAFKEGMLESAHNQKAVATTQAQAAAILEAAKVKAAAAQQTFDNVLATAKSNTAIAAQQATAAYQSGQLSQAQYNGVTSRMNTAISQQNANTSSYNATKPKAGAAGGGTGSGGSLTYSQAQGNIDDYTKLQTTLGTLHQGADGKWYGSAANTNQIANAAGVVLPTVDVLVDVTTLKRQIAELEPAYRASIAVRDKTSGTTTPLSLDATEKANVEGFFAKVNSAVNSVYGSSGAQSADKAAYRLDYATALAKQLSPLYDDAERKAIVDRYNSGG